MIRNIPKIPRLFFNEKQSTNLSTHELLIKLGFLTNPKPGLNNWLPMGLLVLNKLKSIIRTNLNNHGCEELSLLILSSADKWEKTGRWGNTELFKLKDSSKSDYCLSPTSEEDITLLVKNQITSYKELPITYYQVREKFRDEIRPRMGLLRAREFLMNDAYSFDVNEVQAMKSYNNMVSAYHEIFKSLKVPYVKADADSGDIGGDLSHEWHYPSVHGEDTLFKCEGCGSISNIEMTKSAPPKNHKPIDDTKEYFYKDGDEILKIVVPKDREFEPKFLKVHYPQAEETDLTHATKTVHDIRCDPEGLPLVLAQENDHCGHCSSPLKSFRAIEIGHTFYLGTKYTESLDFTLPVPIENSNGKTIDKHVVMGCYGIGISRIIAAVGDLKDDKGFKWPISICPWTVTLVTPPKFKSEDIILDVVEGLNDFRWDNRDIGLGNKIKQSNLLGIPIVVIVGRNFPKVEVETRWDISSPELESLGEKKDYKWIVHKDSLKQFLNILIKQM